jgi:hypothetical protein
MKNTLSRDEAIRVLTQILSDYSPDAEVSIRFPGFRRHGDDYITDLCEVTVKEETSK